MRLSLTLSLVFASAAPLVAQAPAGFDVTTRLDQANQLYRKHDWQGALALYDECLLAAPNHFVVLNNRGLTLHKLGRLDQALQALRTAVATPDLPPLREASIRLNLGKVYAALGRFDEAVTEFDRATRLRPNFAAAHYNAAWVLDEQQRFGEAQAALEKGFGAEAEAIPAAAVLQAIVMAHQGDPALMAHLSLDASSWLPATWVWLLEFNCSSGTGGLTDVPAAACAPLRQALFAIATEQFDVARTALADLRQVSPTSPFGPWLLARVETLSGSQAAAMAAYREAVDLMPTASPGGPGDHYVNRRWTGIDDRLSVLPGCYVLESWTVQDGHHTVDRTLVRAAIGRTDELGHEGPKPLPTPEGMVPVEGASFVMGFDGDPRSSPAHTVHVGPFIIGQCEVTEAQYYHFVRNSGRKPPKHWGIDGPDRADAYQPVCNVAYEDAVAFCEAYACRLPTEAEWEYASRGVAGLRYPWGADWREAVVALDFLRTVGSYEDGRSWCGAFDMVGNVAEWCRDWYAEDYYKSSPLHDPQGPSSGGLRVVRGGSVRDIPESLSAIHRDGVPPGESSSDLGFRTCASVWDLEEYLRSAQ
jgi:formylglycine-generating enzyme required for sulfatase activity